MSVQAEGRFWSGIDVPKTIAGTLAAVSAAVLGSFLGVAGTLIGAALASVVSSIGTEIYHRSIDRGSKKLQSAFVVAPAAVGTPSVGAAADDSPADVQAPERESGTDSGTEGNPRVRRRINWKRVALVAGAFFLLGIGTLTTAELFAGRSAADVTSGRDSGSPTITFDHVSEDGEEKPAPAPQESAAPATEAPATEAPATEAPATEAPATEAPATPGETTRQPTATEPPATPPAGEQPGAGEADQGETNQDKADQSGAGNADSEGR